MIDRTHKLSLTKQAKVLIISRGSVYYRPRPVSDTGLGLTHRIEELQLYYPFDGSQMLRRLLLVEVYKVGPLHVRNLMKRRGIEATYRRPNTSNSASVHKIYPYLLCKYPVIRPNQLSLKVMKHALPGNRAMDFTYIFMKRSFVYLAAAIDWFTRRVLSWRLSLDFCIESVEEALARHGSPIYLILIKAHSSPPLRLPRF